MATSTASSAIQPASGDAVGPPPASAGAAEAPEPRLRRLCSTILRILAEAPSGLGGAVCAELNRVLEGSLQDLHRQLSRELQVVSSTIEQLTTLTATRWIDGLQLAGPWLAELTRVQTIANRVAQALGTPDASAPLPTIARAIQPAEPSVHVGPIARPGLDTGLSTARREMPAPTDGPAQQEPSQQMLAAVEAASDSILGFGTCPGDRMAETAGASCETVVILAHEEGALNLCKRGDLHRRRREYEQAEMLYSKAAEIDPQCGLAYAKRGLLHLVAGQHDLAVEDFSRAIELSGNDAESFSLRGDSHARAGRLEEATRDYEHALQLEPSLHKTRLNWAIALRRLGHGARSLQELSRIVEACPDHAHGYYQRGLVQIECGSYREAMEDFQAALRLKPNHADAREQLQFATERQSRSEQETKPDAPLVKNQLAPPDSDRQVSVQCPVCGTIGLVDRGRLDKPVTCLNCRRRFGVRPDGRSVEVVRTKEGRWVELKEPRREPSRRRWLLGACAALMLLFAAGFSVWKVAKPAKQFAANQLPADLNQRAELFGRAWLRGDVALMRRLTAPTRDRSVYSWYLRNRPPIPRSGESMRASLPVEVKFELASAPHQQGRQVIVKIDGLQALGASSSSTEFHSLWGEAGGTWYFQPDGR